MTHSAPACLRLGRLTRRLAATLPAVAVSEERRTRNDFSRRFRVRQIERLLLRNLRSPESVGIPARARVNNAENQSPHLLPPIFLPDQTSADGCALPIKSSGPLPAVLLIGKRLRWAGPCRAVGIGWVEAIGAESRNFWQENFVGRKIFRRLTSPLAATLPAGVIQKGLNPNVCGSCAAGARVW